MRWSKEEFDRLAERTLPYVMLNDSQREGDGRQYVIQPSRLAPNVWVSRHSKKELLKDLFNVNKVPSLNDCPIETLASRCTLECRKFFGAVDFDKSMGRSRQVTSVGGCYVIRFLAKRYTRSGLF
eukprot:9372502-Karenia_brevis.AAC.1